MFGGEFRFQIEHEEVVKWHLMSITSEHKEAVLYDDTGVTISSRWSLS